MAILLDLLEFHFFIFYLQQALRIYYFINLLINVIIYVKSFTYLGIVYTAGGSFANTFEPLAGQASKAVFKS
jgi:hypothetical protein